MKAYNKDKQIRLTPVESIEELKKGNIRFKSNKRADINLKEQVKATSLGQYPFATVLSCIDSRVSPELIFDQGIGDIFSIRVAGNFINQDILGSLEFTCALAGSKLIIVLGHTSCGAIKGACDNVELGNLTKVIEKIKPAVNKTIFPKDKLLRNSSNMEFVNNVAKNNVELNVEKIRLDSQILFNMENNEEIKIIGAMYDVKSAEVIFFN